VSDSIWKKEISFGRKAKGPKAVEPKAEAAASAEPDEPRAKSESVWKKELSFGRKAKPAKHAAPEPVPAEPVAEPVVSSVTDRIAAFVPEPVAPAAPAPAASAAPAEEAPPLPPTTGDYGWLTQNFDPNEVPDNMPAISAPKVALPRVDAPPAAPDLAPVAAPEPAALELAAPAAAAPAEKKVPFWKKEVSLKRAPKEPRAAKPPKEPKAKKVKQPKEPKAKQASEPKEKQPPFWKRELKLGKPKLERAAKAPAAEKPAKKTRVKKSKGDHGPSSKSALVGLKIGASQVAAARVSNTGTPQLLQVARESLPDGVVVGGELRDIETLAETLKELFANHKLPKKNVRLGIANNRIGVRTFEIAGIDDQKQLANAIRFRAQETLPIPLEEAVLDWQLLSESTDEETGQVVRRVLLVVAYRELVERYMAACRKAGLQVTGIDLEAFAMLRALNAPVSPDAPAAQGAQVVVNVGHDRSTFAVSDGRVCEFTRVLGWGGQSLSVAIARALDLTPSQATPIKHALSLVAQTTELPEGVTHEALATARDAVTRELQTFARELVSSLRFYQNQPNSLGIGELVLTGGTAHLPGLSDELHRLIGVPVRVGDPLNRVVIPKKFREPEYAIGSLTVAIGLGIED
jgi:type IV pilus assembly protein PilM